MQSSLCRYLLASALLLSGSAEEISLIESRRRKSVCGLSTREPGYPDSVFLIVSHPRYQIFGYDIRLVTEDVVHFLCLVIQLGLSSLASNGSQKVSDHNTR